MPGESQELERFKEKIIFLKFKNKTHLLTQVFWLSECAGKNDSLVFLV
jgi:hypothetical protein